MLKSFFRMLRARDGLAAIEFAFVAPVMIVMFFGAVELSAAVDCKTRVTHVASTAADLVAQETTVSSTDMSNVFAALNAIVFPYPSGAAKIVISSILYKTSTTGTVEWSDVQNATKRTVGSTVTIPAGLMSAGGSVILAEITYTYASPTTQVLTGAVTMTGSFYAHPRRSAKVLHT
jgi:Flp pilus assembly protein TadG